MPEAKTESSNERPETASPVPSTPATPTGKRDVVLDKASEPLRAAPVELECPMSLPFGDRVDRPIAAAAVPTGADDRGGAAAANALEPSEPRGSASTGAFPVDAADGIRRPPSKRRRSFTQEEMKEDVQVTWLGN